MLTLPTWARVVMGIPLFTLAAVYVIAAFVAPNATLRIVLRCIPFLPLAVWTLWFDRERPLQGQPPTGQAVGRIVLLLLIMTLVVALLGLGLNWLYDPGRIV
jgi:hypothetical protein